MEGAARGRHDPPLARGGVNVGSPPGQKNARLVSSRNQRAATMYELLWKYYVAGISQPLSTSHELVRVEMLLTDRYNRDRAAKVSALISRRYRLGSPRAGLLCRPFSHSMFACARDAMWGMWIVGDGACHGTRLHSSSSAHRLIKFH